MISTKNLEKIRVNSREELKSSAIHFRDLVSELCDLRIAACQNIAKNATLRDIDGKLLATTVFGWNEDSNKWWNTESMALKSPITIACRYESEPFWLNAKGIHTRQPNQFLQEMDLARFEHRAFTHAAIVVPVHMPFGQIGAVSYNPLSKDKVDLSEIFEQHGDVLAIYARAFIRSYVNVSDRTPILPLRSKLSKREVECLRWAALGKTDHEIGIIIDRSRATVRFHFQNATRKLDAVNRSQAVYKATQLGYISTARQQPN